MPKNYVTVPNQRTVVVHRARCDRDFLQIKKDTMYEAYRVLDYPGLFLYLVLAANKDNYEFAFSPSAVYRETGMPESTSRDQFKKLIACRYLVPRREDSNIYDFYEHPQPREEEPDLAEDTAPIEEKNTEPPQATIKTDFVF